MGMIEVKRKMLCGRDLRRISEVLLDAQGEVSDAEIRIQLEAEAVWAACHPRPSGNVDRISLWLRPGIIRPGLGTNGCCGTRGIV